MEDVLKFETWKAELRKYCEKEDKLLAFNLIDDDILWMFFNRGVKPTPESITANSQVK